MAVAEEQVATLRAQLAGQVEEHVRPLDQLALSGRCGFSSTVEGNMLTYDQQVAKLRLIVETARDVWG